MKHILKSYGIPAEKVNAIMMLYMNTRSMVRSPDGDTQFFDITTGVLQGDTIAPFLFIICLDYVLKSSIDCSSNFGFTLKKRRSRSIQQLTSPKLIMQMILLSQLTQWKISNNS